MTKYSKQCPKQKFGVARKTILCRNKKFDVARKSVSCRQKQLMMMMHKKKYFVLKKVINFFLERRDISLRRVFKHNEKVAGL